jgi:PAS domain S-box-containing protein
MPQIKLTKGHKVSSPKLRLTKDIVLTQNSAYSSDLNTENGFLNEVLDTTPFHLATIDKNGFFTSWNKASEKMFGYTKDEAVGKLKPSNLHTSQEEAAGVIKKALENGEFHEETILVRKDGQNFPALLDVKALYGQNGHINGFLGSAIDLSKEKKIEKEREISEEKYRQVFENSKDAILYIDCKGNIIDVNSACKEISGYSPEDFIGKNIYNLPFLMINPEYANSIFNFYKKKEAKLFQLDIVHKNGGLRTVEANANFIEKDGHASYIQVMARDITARKAAEDALRESENTYRAIFENIGNATMIINNNDTISYANAQFVNMSGYTRDEILNKKKWFDFFSAKDLSMMRKFHALRRVNPYSAPRNYEANFITADGDVRNIFMSVDMIPGTDKSVASLLDITARKIVENELRASKKLFDDLVQGSPVAIYVIDTNHKVVYWNKAMEEMTGLSASQIIGTSNHWKPFGKRPAKQISDMIIDGAKCKDICRMDCYNDADIEKHQSKDSVVCSKFFKNFHGGGNKWLRFKVKPLYDLQNKLVGALETVEDITENKQMSQYLENRMREFQILYQISVHKRMTAPLSEVLGSIVKDLVQACDEIKPARARISFDGKIYSTLKNGENFARKIEESIKINGEKRGGIQLGYIEKIQNKDSYSMRNEKKLIHIIADIIGRHVERREILERYQKLVVKSVTGIFILQNNLFQYVNPKFARMFRFKNEEAVIGMPYERIIPNCDCHIKLKENHKLNSLHCTVKANRNDGTSIDVEIFTQVIQYYGKMAILGTIQDVTKLREANDRQMNFSNELKIKIAEKTKDLELANRRLKSLNELKDEFIAVTSHELRSPLTAARGYLSFLIDDELINQIPKEAKDYLVRVYDNVESLNNLVNNLLDVSRIDMNRFELNKTPTDIVEMIKQTVKSLSFQANEKKLTISFVNKLNADSLALNLDNVRVRQVLRNILDNAIKFSPVGKEIRVEIEIRGIGVQISFFDQGMGIRKSEIIAIFDKFKQGKNSQTRYAGGAGLGLFIAKKIVELHNGMIWAESEIRRGTVFHIQLPLD